MGRNATRSQQAKTRARQTRLEMLAERRAQDERIEDAAAAALLAWEDAAALRARLAEVEQQVASALAALRAEAVSVAAMAALTGITQAECQRLLRLARSGDAAR